MPRAHVRRASPLLGTRRRRPLLGPGWPLVLLFGGYPLWWALGLGEFSCLVFAIPMVVHLARAGQVTAPRGLGVWLLFVVWVVGGLVVLQVHAPGTVSGASSTRYLTFTYRLLWYVAATVVLLYVGNTRSVLSNRRISLALANMFIVVSAGGLLGLLAPHLQFRSAVEYVLPASIRGNGFLQGLIHPVTAQVQHFLGYDEARPSAPFAFTNEWGLAVACFLPFFLITWCRRDAGWRRFAAVPVLLLSTVSIVYSLNRGLWLALTATALMIGVRYAVMGRAKLLALLAGTAFAVAAVVVLSPLGSLVRDRLAHPESNQGRTNLGRLTFDSVVHGSPLLGFGTTRNALGNFSSIAAAATAACPGCSPPPLGTQGHLWLVMFSQGLVGLLLYLAFFVSQLLRHLRLESPYVVAALSVLFIHLVTMPVYDSIGPSLFAIMISVGLLWRARMDAEERPGTSTPGAPGFRPAGQAFARYVAVGTRHGPTVLLAFLVGAGAGLVYQVHRGVPYVATESVLLPAQRSLTSTASSVTLDTEARLVTADRVLDVVARAEPPGLTHAQLAARVLVSVSPNTRILHIAFSAPTPQQALAGARAFSSAYLRLRSDLEGATATAVQPGQVVQDAAVNRSVDSRVVAAGSGAMIAMCLILIYWRQFGDGRATARRLRRVTTRTGLPVLAVVRSGELDGALPALARHVVGEAVAPPTSALACAVAGRLDQRLTRDQAPHVPGAPGWRVSPPTTVIVAASGSRVRDLRRLDASLRRCGQQVPGVVVVRRR